MHSWNIELMQNGRSGGGSSILNAYLLITSARLPNFCSTLLNTCLFPQYCETSVLAIHDLVQLLAVSVMLQSSFIHIFVLLLRQLLANQPAKYDEARSCVDANDRFFRSMIR